MDAHEQRVALDVLARRLWQETKDTERSPALVAALAQALELANDGIVRDPTGQLSGARAEDFAAARLALEVAAGLVPPEVPAPRGKRVAKAIEDET